MQIQNNQDAMLDLLDSWTDPVEQVQEYLRSLQPGERVIETGSSCMTGRTGTVYISENTMTKGSICVKWDALPGDTGQMGTAATWGTRRISDVTT